MLINNYDEAVAFLEGLPQFRSGYGYDRGMAMLDMLGRPEKAMKLIHVAGTNGKGSVCLYLHDMLSSQGIRTGLFTSPHLIDIRERIILDGQLIDKESFYRCFMQVREADIKLGGEYLAYFEYLLGIAMLYYKEQGVQMVVVETGLGGQLDSTNALMTPIISVITTISLEHTAILGDSIDEIARQKAGIIREGALVVYYDSSADASAVIEAVARDRAATAVGFGREEIDIVKTEGDYIDFSISNSYYSNDVFGLSTGALYQTVNCGLALKVMAVLKERGYISYELSSIKEALRKASWMGRMQRLDDNLYVDGAHNPEGIQALLESIHTCIGDRKIVLLFSAVVDKNFHRMVQLICESGYIDRAVVTQIEGKRKLEALAIKEAFAQYDGPEVEIRDNIREAIEYASELADRTDSVLLATGSLYLVGEIEDWRKN